MNKKSFIHYQAGFKYQLVYDYWGQIDIMLPQDITFTWFSISKTGEIKVKRGYAWDGPSGPTIDTKNFMRGSLVHDALYQLMREQKIDIDHRDEADRLLRQHCREDGMSVLRAWIVYLAVKWFGKKSALPDEGEEEIYQAP